MRPNRPKIIGLCLLTLSLAFFCACELNFQQDGQRALPNSVPSHRQWTITAATGRFNGLPKAIDGDINTTAVAVGGNTGATVTIDLGRSSVFNMIILTHGQREWGFATQLTVSTSLDGRRFTEQATTPGCRKVSYVPLFKPVRARYIRIQASRPGSQPWALAEILIQ
jgi:hypothetical protein